MGMGLRLGDCVLQLKLKLSWHELSEKSIYDARSSDDSKRRDLAHRIIKERFKLQQEIRHVLNCHDLPGVAKCVGVVIADEVRIQIKGRLFEFLARGDLADYCL